MLLLHEFAHFIAKKEGREGTPFGLIIASAFDLLIDGLLIGVSFLAGEASGVVIALSLSLCAFFLSVTVASTMTKKSRKSSSFLKRLLAVGIIGVMLPIGAFIGSAIVSELPAWVLIETIAFGVAALLFLGIEELLAEAHEGHDTIWISGAFFLGFFAILIFRV